MERRTRRIHFAGCTTNPDEPWMKQIARNLTDPFDGFLKGTRYLLMDRDGKYCKTFRDMLEREGINCVRLPSRSPNSNAHLEGFFGSLKAECLDRMIFFGDKSLRSAVPQYLEHFHSERNHQGLDNRIIKPSEEVGRREGAIPCRERLGGMLKYYFRDLAA